MVILYDVMSTAGQLFPVEVVKKCRIYVYTLYREVVIQYSGGQFRCTHNTGNKMILKQELQKLFKL